MRTEKHVMSTSQLTGKEYKIPCDLDDKKNIDTFVELNSGKKVIAVQGLGFVGAVMSLVCANSNNNDYCVLGIDLANQGSYWRIASLNDGIFPISAEDPKIQNYYEESLKKNNFYATYDEYAYSVADIIIVDINLDIVKTTQGLSELVGYDVELSVIERAIETVARNCKEEVLILVETTVPPGTTEKLILPIIQQEMINRGLRIDQFKLGHSYERVMPGPNYIDSIHKFPRVYSGVDVQSANATEEFLKTIIDTKSCPLTRLANTNATEMAKVLENSYRAMNIAFVAEWSRFAEEAGVDLYSVVNAIRKRPTHANLMYPGLGVGGYCLTKDPLLASWSRRNFFNSKSGLIQSENAVSINDRMPLFALEFLKSRRGSLMGVKTLLLGVSYRGDVGDTRSSPVELLYRGLQAEGAELTVHDPYVSYWREKAIQVNQDLEKALDSAVKLVIISTGHSLYVTQRAIDLIMRSRDLLIFDTIGLLSAEQISIFRSRHEVIVLGRGDI